MNLKIKNCNECPFLVREYDFESGDDNTYLTCNLLDYRGNSGSMRFLHEDLTQEVIEKIYTPLPECPLRKENLEIELI
jgi:hypothetical protein